MVSAKEKEIKRAQKLIISPLIEVYILSKEKNPSNLNELLEFNPVIEALDVLQKEIDAVVTRCETAWGRFRRANITKGKNRPILSNATLQEVDSAFGAFSIFLQQKAKNPLVFFQILKWIRDAGRPGETREVATKKRIEKHTKLS